MATTKAAAVGNWQKAFLCLEIYITAKGRTVVS